MYANKKHIIIKYIVCIWSKISKRCTTEFALPGLPTDSSPGTSAPLHHIVECQLRSSSTHLWLEDATILNVAARVPTCPHFPMASRLPRKSWSKGWTEVSKNKQIIACHQPSEKKQPKNGVTFLRDGFLETMLCFKRLYSLPLQEAVLASLFDAL